MQKVFNLTNKYIILATPLILFTLLSGVYMAISAGGKGFISAIFAVILMILMSAAFFAGWFNMVKNAILNQDMEDPNALIKLFLPGVGEYFLSCMGSFFTIFLLNIVSLIIVFYLGVHFIGNPGISADSLSKAMVNTESLKLFLSGLTTEQLIKINLWNLSILFSLTVTYFFFLLYIPALFFKTKNPFKAFFINIKDLFSKKIIVNAGIYILIFGINLLISMFSAVFANNFLINFIMTLVNFYFICLASVGVFLYYYNNFVGQQIGQNIDIEV